MTYINTTTTQVEINITDETGATTTVTTPPAPEVVTAFTAGPQGPPGANLAIVSNTPTTGSVVYYDTAVGLFRVDSDHTFSTLVDGGNF